VPNRAERSWGARRHRHRRREGGSRRGKRAAIAALPGSPASRLSALLGRHGGVLIRHGRRRSPGQVREIGRLGRDQLLAFIRPVGKATKVLTDGQPYAPLGAAAGGWTVCGAAAALGAVSAAAYEWFALTTGRRSYTGRMPVLPVPAGAVAPAATETAGASRPLVGEPLEQATVRAFGELGRGHRRSRPSRDASAGGPCSFLTMPRPRLRERHTTLVGRKRNGRSGRSGAATLLFWVSVFEPQDVRAGAPAAGAGFSVAPSCALPERACAKSPTPRPRGHAE
jgi:hypothetical protein